MRPTGINAPGRDWTEKPRGSAVSREALLTPRGDQEVAPECGRPRGAHSECGCLAEGMVLGWGEPQATLPGGEPVSPLLEGIRKLPDSFHRSDLPSLNFVDLPFLHVSDKYWRYLYMVKIRIKYNNTGNNIRVVPGTWDKNSPLSSCSQLLQCIQPALWRVLGFQKRVSTVPCPQRLVRGGWHTQGSPVWCVRVPALLGCLGLAFWTSCCLVVCWRVWSALLMGIVKENAGLQGDRHTGRGRWETAGGERWGSWERC